MFSLNSNKRNKWINKSGKTLKPTVQENMKGH